MSLKLTKIAKFYDSLQQTIKDARVLKKCTKETDVIFLEVLNSHIETVELLLKLLDVRKASIYVYGE